MGEEVTNINEVKTTSDGDVKISLEKYNELVKLAVAKPPTYIRREVIRTPEMLSKECRVWGGGLMGLGASLFAVGVYVYRNGHK